jgi:hypothetical protein
MTRMMSGVWTHCDANNSFVVNIAATLSSQVRNNAISGRPDGSFANSRILSFNDPPETEVKDDCEGSSSVTASDIQMIHKSVRKMRRIATITDIRIEQILGVLRISSL